MDLSYIVNKNPFNVDLSESFMTSAEPFYKTKDGLANQEVSLLIPARVDKTHYVTYVHAILTGATAGANCEITVKDGEILRYKTFIPTAAVVGTDKIIQFDFPLAISTGVATEIKATAAGAGAVITLNVGGYTL